METSDADQQSAAEKEQGQLDQKLQLAHSRLQQLDSKALHGLGGSLLKTAKSKWVHVRDVMHSIARAMTFAHHKTDVFQMNSREVIAQAQSGAIKVQLDAAEPRELHNINWMQQGNKDFYTEDMLVQRYQLRGASAVVSAVQTWWRFLLSWQIRSLSSDCGAPPTLDDVACSELLKPVYSAMVVAIQMVLLPRFGMEGDPGYDPEEDWRSDCKGQPTLSYAHFFDAMFELTDMWCETVSAGDYASLLNKALDDVQQQEQQSGLFASALRRFNSATQQSPRQQQQQQQQQHGERQQEQEQEQERGGTAGQQQQLPPAETQTQQQQQQQQGVQQQQQGGQQQQQGGQQHDHQGRLHHKEKKPGAKDLQQKHAENGQHKQEHHRAPQQQRQQQQPKTSSSGACPAFTQAIDHLKRSPSELEASQSERSRDEDAAAHALHPPNNRAVDQGGYPAGAMHVMPLPHGLSPHDALGGAVHETWRDIPWYNKYMSSVISRHQQQDGSSTLLPPLAPKQRQGGGASFLEMLPPSDMGDATLSPAREPPPPPAPHRQRLRQAGGLGPEASAASLRPDGLTSFEAYVAKKMQSQELARLQPVGFRPQQLQPLRLEPEQLSPGALQTEEEQEEQEEEGGHFLPGSPPPKHKLSHLASSSAAPLPLPLPLQLPELKNAQLGGAGPMDVFKARKRRQQEAEAQEEFKLHELGRTRAIEAMYDKEKTKAVWTSAFTSKTSLSSDNILMHRHKHLGYIPHSGSSDVVKYLPALPGQRDSTCAGAALQPRDVVRLPSIFG